MLCSGSCNASTSLLREPPVPPPSPCPGMPSERPGCGSGGEGRIPFCRCRVIYDMRESHCLDSSCIFSEGFASLPRPPLCCCYCTVAMGLLPVPRLCGAVPGRAARRPGPICTPSPLPQPSRPTCRGPGNGALGPSKFTATGGIQLPEGRGGVGGQRDLGRLAPFSLPFQRRQCPRCIQIPRPFLLLTSAHINKLPHRASVEQSVP